MDQVINAFEHIKVIRGLNNGNISLGQLQTILQRYHLDDAQQTALNALLSASGIQPLPDSQLPRPMISFTPAPKVPPKKEISPEVRAERFARLLACYQEALEEAPDLARQYQDELPLLKLAIASEAKDIGVKRPDLVLTKAIMVISRHRVRDIRHRGWVCGTHSSNVRDFFRRKLNFVCSAAEQKALIQYCTDPGAEAESHFDELLLLMLHDAPRIIVHRNLSDPFWD